MKALSFKCLVVCLLSTASLSQEAMPFPLQPDGMDEISGQLKLSPSAVAIASMQTKNLLVLRGLTLPDAGQVDLELTRIPLESLGLGFQVNGQPAPGLLVGLDLSVWKGTVIGDLHSDVFLSFSSVGTRGWVDHGHDRYHLLPQPGDGMNWADGYTVIVENKTLASLGVDLGMTCGSEKLARNQLADDEIPNGNAGSQFLGGGNTATLWECAIAIETDYQLHQVFGNNLAAQTAYTTSLLAAGSDRYIEQNNTRLVYPYVQFYTSSGDPWTSQDMGGNSINLLDEFLAAWAGSALPGNADIAHFLSGASLGGGVAYLSVLCDPSNNFSFGVSGNLEGNVPFPIQQGPINWDFMVFTHELGHNFSSPHTHDFCPPIDQCAPMDYFGSCQTLQVCTSSGTIMSYCHLCPGGISNITTYFHPTTVATISSHVQACLPIVLGISSNPPISIPPTVPTALTATVSGSPTAVELHYRFSAGASYTVLTMSPQGGGVYGATLPAPTCLDEPEFFFRAIDANGPFSTGVFSPVVGTPTTLFSDNFQADLGWTVGAGDDDATTGIWTRVDPNPTSAQPGEGVNPASGPFCFVTGQGTPGGSLGENDIDNGKTTLFSPTFDLTGMDADIGYWRWYSNDTSADINNDIFEVEVSANGTTWVDVETVGPAGAGTSGGWIYHQFRVSDFIPPSVSVQVRFVASDEGAGSLIEAGVDDFQVFTIDCPVGPQPPMAEFLGSPTSGIRPLTVSFTDNTTGIATSWGWDFGDTGSSTLQHPSHTYIATGTYTVALTATGPDGMDVETKINYIVVSEAAPTANFSGSPTMGVGPLTVDFFDTSTGMVTAWSWSFGDAGSSSSQNPSHTYALPGTYTVSMSATGPGGVDVETKSDYIIVTGPPPSADFSAVPTSGLRPLSVNFSDLSTGMVSSWLWSFGDSDTSIAQNPAHTYSLAGTYTVSMLAVGPGGSDVETKADYIVVTDPAPPVANFSGSPTSGLVPLAVSFSDTSSGSVTSWLWSFGDTGSSTMQNPAHTYTLAGTYTVSMLAVGPGGSSTETKANYIVAAGASVANFSASLTSGGEPLTVSFTDLSSPTVTSWSWDFGDTNSSTDQNPSHIYVDAGIYSVSLSVDGPGGSDTLLMSDLITVHPAATSVFRNGSGVNPACFIAAPPVIGTQWLASVDSGAVAGATLTIILARTQPIPGILLAAGELLIDPSSGLLFNSFASATGGLDQHTFSVPNDLSYLGNEGHLQAFLFGPLLQWCNAAHLTVGFPATSPAPSAGFSGAPTTGAAPLTVFFNDTSAGSISGWTWSFGDGGSSTLQNPTHTYVGSGTYSVSLTVQGEGGFDVSTQPGYVTVP